MDNIVWDVLFFVLGLLVAIGSIPLLLGVASEVKERWVDHV